MYIKLFLLCAGFICSNALPVSSSIEGAKLLDQFDSYVNTTCPAFRDNVLVNRTTKYLLNCKDVALQNPPENTALINCMAIIASNIQLCKVIGNRQDTSTPNTVDDLYKMVDELKANKPADICEQFKRFDLFKESANITYIDNWTKILLNIFTSKKCLVACTEMVGDDSNEQCSLLLLINEKVQNDPQQNPKIIVTEPLNIATQNHFKDTAATTKTTDKKSNAVKAADAKPATVGKLETAQKAANIPVRTESNPPVQVTSVQSSPKEVQPLSKVISPPKLSIDPPLPSNTQGKVDSTNTAANNNGNSANIIPKQETTIPEEPTTHPTIPVPVNPKPAGDKPPSVPQIEVSQSAQNDIEIDFTNDPSRMGGDNQEDEYPNEDADDEAIPHEKVIANLNTNDIYGSEQKISTGDHFVEVEDSNFFSYFMFISVMFIVGYIVYHNKQKIMALLLEGRRDRNSRRRPSTSSYRKLNSNLEEAVTSKCSGSAAHVIY